MKRGFVFFMLAIVCIFTFTACKKEKPAVKQEPQTEANEEGEYKFGFSCLTLKDNEYFIDLEKNIRKNVEEAGHTLITKDAQSDIELQNQQIDELIAEGIHAIFLIPVDWVEIEPALERLNEADIKIINIDTQVLAMDKISAYVGSNNYKAGKLCGQDMKQRIPQGGKIILVECPNRNSINERIRGFEKSIAKKFEVVARINAKADLTVALTEVEAALQEHPDVVAIMCGNDTTAIGALVAANVVAPNKLIIYGIDGSPDAKEEISKPESMLVATVAQSTTTIGQKSVEIALKILRGESYETITYTDIYLITKENIGEYDINTWQ